MIKMSSCWKLWTSELLVLILFYSIPTINKTFLPLAIHWNIHIWMASKRIDPIQNDIALNRSELDQVNDKFVWEKINKAQ